MRVVIKKPPIEQSQMLAYKRAINATLASRPVSDSPVLNAELSHLPHMLAALDFFVGTLDEYHPLRQARKDTIQYERTHSDVEGLKSLLGVDDDWLDQVFLDAMELEQ